MMHNNSDGNTLPAPATSMVRIGAVAVCLYIVLYIGMLWSRPLILPDEMRYSEIPREMVAGGDWTKLRLCGFRYYEKPPLGYWLNAASISLFGHNNMAVRLPTALSAGFAALALFFLVRRTRQSSERALAAAVIFLTFFEVLGVGTFLVLDTLFTCFVTFSLTFFFTAAEASGKKKLFWLVLSGVACGAAFLTKGFTALVVPALTLAVWLPWQKRYREMLYIWLVPAVVAFLTVLPFALAIERSNPGYWHYFFWVEHVQRFLNPGNGQHRQPFWYFLPILALGALPWIFFLPDVFVATRARSASKDALTRFCLCWLILPFLFFSACGGKLLAYILPCFAPLAVLTADALFTSTRNTRIAKSAKAAGVFLVAAFFGFLVWLALVPADLHLRSSIMNDPQCFMIGASLLLAAFLLFRAAALFGGDGNRLRATAMTGLAMCCLFLTTKLFLPEGVENNKSPQRLLERTQHLVPDNALVMGDLTTLSAVCWQYRRNDAVLIRGRGELEYGLQHPEAEERYAETHEKAAGMIEQALQSERPVAICMREQSFDAFTKAVPDLRPSRRDELSTYVWMLFLPERSGTRIHPQ